MTGSKMPEVKHAIRYMNRIAFAYDKQTARSFDADGRMRVRDCILSTAEVNPYFGKEIVDHERLGLDPNRVYELFRDPEEMGTKDAIASAQGVPIMIKHIAQTAEEPRHEYQAGSVHSVRFDGKHLRGDLLVSDGRAIELIEADELSDLSCGYRYEPVKYSGEFKGKQYDIRMTNLRFNHVALVDDGRASGAHVADSAFRNPNLPDPSLNGESTMPEFENGRQPGAAPLPGANDAPPAAGAMPGAAAAPAAGGDPMSQIGAALKMIAEQMTAQHQAILSAISGGSGQGAQPAPDMQQAQGAEDTDAAETDYGRENMERAEGARDGDMEAMDNERAMDNENGEGDEMEQRAEDEDLELERAVPGESEGEGSPPSPTQSAGVAAPGLLRKGGQQGTFARGNTTPFGAMDAKTVKTAISNAVKQERARAAAVETAKRAVLGVLGPVYGMDSAGAIYREALKQVGHDVSKIPAGMAGVAWRAHVMASQKAAGVGVNPELAMDSSQVDASQKSILGLLSKISVKG